VTRQRAYHATQLKSQLCCGRLIGKQCFRSEHIRPMALCLEF
jgi:hypothetical protein